jgi:GNAT superfamily N-acetyltransferase
MAGITTRQRALAAAFLAIGIAVRLRLFFAARSLWLDEAMLALNLLRRSSLGLFRPLDFEQSAPPLFLWLERAAVTIGGSSEMVLRTVPMLAGIATLLILAVLAARLLPPAAALFAIGLAALSPLLIHFGNEFKQYSLDGLAAAGLLLSTHRVLVSPDERRRWLALVGIGAVSVWLSAFSVFILAGAGFGLLTHRPSREHLGWIAAAGVIWISSFVAPYLAVYRDASRNDYIERFWSEWFLDPRAPDFLQRVSTAVSGIVEDALFGTVLELPGPLLVLAVGVSGLGLFVISQARGKGVGILLVAPALLVAVAALLSAYPPAPRLLVGLAPMLILSLAAGLYGLASLVPARSREAALAVLGAFTLTPAVVSAVSVTTRPPDPAPARIAITLLRQGLAPVTPVYVHARVLPVWIYYTTDWRRPDSERVNWLVAAAQSLGPNSGNRPSRRRAVEEEGTALQRPGGWGTELIGVPTGIEYPLRAGAPRTPDPGWGANEARRLLAACHLNAWLLFLHGYDVADETLIAELRARGIQVDEIMAQGAVRLYRVRCPSAEPSHR